MSESVKQEEKKEHSRKRYKFSLTELIQQNFFDKFKKDKEWTSSKKD